MKVAAARFTSEQNRAIISRRCTECISDVGEVCVNGDDSTDFHHEERVLEWLADPLGLALPG